MATSSAVPDNLQTFVSQAGAATGEVKTDLSSAASALNAFLDAPNSGFGLPGGGGVIRAAGTYVSDAETVERTVATIRQAFLNADATTVADSSIDRALSRAGLSATPPATVTFDEPVFKGPALLSGWSDDPVSTATGHFLEQESDLVMPEGLSLLSWARTYTSRWLVEGALGRGWSCWADARLEVGALSVTYVGPDGQAAELDRVEGGFARCPGLEADLVATDGGFELRWWWVARFPGMVMVFDASGGLVEVRDPFGGVTGCERDGDGRLVGLTHEGGRRLRLVWDSGRVVRVESSDGRAVVYEFGEGGDLVGVERPGGSRRYVVDVFGRIGEVFDADGVREVANEYDSAGRVLSQVSPFGRVTFYTYLVPNTVAVGDERGDSRTLYRHDSSGRLLQLVTGSGRSTRRRFDEAGNVVEIVDLDGGVTTREFDAAGNCVSETTPDGATVRWAYDEQRRVVSRTTAGGALFEFAYADGTAALPARIEGPGGWFLEIESVRGQPVRVVDADGVSVSYERDADGSVLAVTDGEGNATRYDRHPSGAYTRIVAPTGETLEFEVDGAGRALSATLPGRGRAAASWSAAGRLTGLRSASGATTVADWGDHGAVAALTDPQGTVTSYEYDRLGQLIGTRLADGSDIGYSYDRLGNLIDLVDSSGARWQQAWSPTGAPATLTDPDGFEHRVETDPCGRVTAALSPLGRRSEITWDPDGRPVKARDFEGAVAEVRRDAAGRVIESRLEGRRVATYTYTPGGRVASMSLEDGSTWGYRYDRAGRVVAVDDPDGARTTWELDAGGRPASWTDSEGAAHALLRGPAGELAKVVADGRVVAEMAWDDDGRLTTRSGAHGEESRFSYDADGRLVGAVDPEGGVTRIGYDVLGRRTLVEAPDGALWKYEYAGDGRSAVLTDPIGRRTSVEQDPAGRVVRLSGSDGSVQNWGWDADGRLIALHADGQEQISLELDDAVRIGRTTDAAGQVSEVTWDRLGRVLSAGEGRTALRCRYDDEAGLAAVGVGGAAREIVYRRDRRGRLVSIEHPDLGTVTLTHDRNGRITRLHGSGLERTWGYDAAGNLTLYREDLGGAIRSTRLERDAVGRLSTERTREGDGEEVVRRYRYDRAGQLLAEEGPEGTRSWTYDACGRLIAEQGPGGSRSFIYDLAGQLVAQIDEHGQEVHYTYDALGRRTGEDGSGLRVRYHWDALGQLKSITRVGPGSERTTVLGVGPTGDLREVNDTPVVWLPEGVLGQAPLALGDQMIVGLQGHPVAAIGSDGVEWLSVDWRGSTGAGLGADPWGYRPGGEVSGRPELGFRGEVCFDGLVWLRNRVYDPATRAFLSPDPLPGSLVQPGGWANPYQYAENDPVGKLDPSGLKPVTAAQAAQQMQGWRQGHWGEIASGLLAAGAVVMIATGVGAPIGAGILIGEGMSIATQGLTTGHVNFDQVALSGALGGLGGGVASAVSGLSAVGDVSLAVGSRFGGQIVTTAVANGIGGAAGGFASGAAGQLITTGSIQPVGLAEDTGLGFGLGFAGGAGMRAFRNVQNAGGTDPASIRFSQSSVNGAPGLAKSMEVQGWAGRFKPLRVSDYSSGPISSANSGVDVVRMPDGDLTTVDNTRVLAARQAGLNAKVNLHGYDDPIDPKQAQRFMPRSKAGGPPTTWGEAVTNRIGKQNAAFRNAFPMGSPEMSLR